MASISSTKLWRFLLSAKRAPRAAVPLTTSKIVRLRQVLWAEKAFSRRAAACRVAQLRLIISAEHEEEDVHVGRVEKPVQVSPLEHGKMPGAEGSDLETALALGHLAPVADDHKPLTVDHEEDLLVVAVPVQADAAVVHQDMEVHVIDGEEVLVPFAVSLLAEGVEHPGLDLPPQLFHPGILAVVREEV